MGEPQRQGSPEKWGSKLGVIMAVAGSAVGLGNFLRFPGQAAANGGGAFMIPYFISFLIVGVPICWAEWSMGRYGGRYGFNSSPGIFSVLWRRPHAKYIGALGLLIPIVIYMYYVYIESWCLIYAVDYLLGNLELGKNPALYSTYFQNMTGVGQDGAIFTEGGRRTLFFFAATFVTNFVLIYLGITKGIERFCKVAMPLLMAAGLVVVIRVLTLPEQPLPEPWQVGLAKALPAAEWNALAALAREPSTSPDEMKSAVGKAFVSYFERTRAEQVSNGSPVFPPAGFEDTPDGFLVAMAQLRSGEVGEQWNAWISKTRDTLDRDAKIELQAMERDEMRLIPDNGAGRLAIEKRRKELLASPGPMPSLAPFFPENFKGNPEALERRAAALQVSALPRTVFNGLGYMWNPDFERLADPSVWLAAAGQIFFSLSVGFGIVLTYASYLRKDDDVVLSGLTASSMNEFCEVVLGGLIAIPATFIFLGTAMTLSVINSSSTFGLGFNTLPTVFANMPAGRWFGATWFSLLFLAAVTSSLSMLQPAIAFLEEGFGLKRRVSVAGLGLLTVGGALPVVYFSKDLAVLSTLDDWVGTVCIYLLATIQVIVFAWVVGVKEGFEEAHRGADMRIPWIFAPILKFVTPLFLLVILTAWVVNNLLGKFADMKRSPAVMATVIGLAVFFVFLLLLIKLAGEQWRKQGRGNKEVES